MSGSKCDDCPRVRALEAEVATLRRKVEELMRAGKRQAAPFSKGEPKRNAKRVIRTARQQGREPVSLMVRLQRSPRPLDLGLARGPLGRVRLVPLPRGQPQAIAA